MAATSYASTNGCEDTLEFGEDAIPGRVDHPTVRRSDQRQGLAVVPLGRLRSPRISSKPDPPLSAKTPMIGYAPVEFVETANLEGRRFCLECAVSRDTQPLGVEDSIVARAACGYCLCHEATSYRVVQGGKPMTLVHDALLDSKMTEIERARSWSPRVISKLEGLIREGSDRSLYRVNPLAFARERSIEEAESIDLFLHAARSGLFEMHWDVLCPQSGMVLESFGTLRTLKTHYVCGLCDVSGETDLDDFIEVTFSLSPGLRQLSFHEPDILSVEDYHWMLRFSESCRLPGLQIRFLDYLKSVTRAMTFLPPGSTTTIRVDLAQGALAGVNIRNQAAFMLPVTGGPAVEPQKPRIRYDGQRFSPSLPALSAGPTLIEVDNTGSERGSLLLINWPPEIVAMTVKPALDFDPYVSGAMLLARESFRRLFRSERVDEKEGIGIRQVTLLFTDLKGSTSMYERLGDLNAYALVREHFAFLHQVAQRHSGAIVKTIGDAVMAVFSRPADAVAAALHIVEETGRFNRGHGGPGIILKLGAHCGPSIAVTLNDNLDYFGQTVNVAARVQSLAGAGEICITEALYAAPGVKELVSGRTLVEFAAPLRGVEGDAHVYRITA